MDWVVGVVFHEVFYLREGEDWWGVGGGVVAASDHHGWGRAHCHLVTKIVIKSFYTVSFIPDNQHN